MESTINKLFDSKNRKFIIPSYQRAYSWEEKQISQFIEDIKSSKNQYYLGHFLFEAEGDNIRYVIDGQQRLTTCVIFFSVVKNELKKRQSNGEVVELNLDDIEDYYLKDLRKGTQKLSTVDYDNNFFLDEVIEGKESHAHDLNTESKRRIRAAKNIFERECSSESVATETLMRWCRLVENATITEYVVKDKIQAIQIFAFQNDRGKKLSNLEVIKAYFMLQICLSSDTKENIKESNHYLEEEFKTIYKQIVRVSLDEDEVLNYYWRAVSGDGYASSEVIKGVKERLAALDTDRTDWIKEFVSGLSQAFETVEQFENNQGRNAIDLRYLNHMALTYPFLIKARRITTDVPTIERLLMLFENITFRYLLRGGRADLQSRLNPYLINMGSGEMINKTVDCIVQDLKNNGWWSYWNDQTVKIILSGYFYQNRVDNYLLWKYELYLCNENHPTPHKVSFCDLIRNESIEHIAPQKPTDNQPIMNGYGIYEDIENPELGIESGNWMNCIGNLMLISQSHNSSIGNKPFKAKIESYGLDNLLNQQKEVGTFVENLSNPVWDNDSIKKRRDKIVVAAQRIWNLDRI